MKYIVMECHFSYAILLDEEGRFLKAANRGYQVGQSVYDPVLVGAYRYRPPMVRIAARGVALAVACLLLIFGITYYRYNVEAVTLAEILSFAAYPSVTSRTTPRRCLTT